MKLVRFTLQYFKGQWHSFIFYLITSIGIAAISVTLPFLTGRFVDGLIIADDTRFVINFAIMFIILYMAIIILTYLGQLVFVKAQMETSFTLNKCIIEHIFDAKYRHAQVDTAYLNNRIIQDVNALVGFTISTISAFFVNGITIIATFILMLAISQFIAIIFLGFVVAYIVFYVLFKKPLYNRSLALQEQRDYFYSTKFEQVHFSKFAKTHGAKQYMIHRLLDAFKVYKRVFFPYQYLAMTYSGLDRVILYIAQALLMVVGGFQIINGNLTIGFFTILSSYFSSIFASTSYFFTLGASYQRVKASFDRIQDVLNWKKEEYGNAKLPSIDLIEGNKLSLSFSEKPLFQDISFQLEKGKIYSITGDNGTGKSTLLTILLGIVSDYGKGEIEINSVRLENLDLDLLRGTYISYVEQDPSIMSDSLKNNLLLGKELTDEKNKQINMLVDLLGFRGVVDSLPKGLDTMISKNSGLSGGEKQKIAIIRALIADPDVLLFDEPTAALDYETKFALIDYLDRIKESKIIVIVTHDEDVLEVCEKSSIHLVSMC